MTCNEANSEHLEIDFVFWYFDSITSSKQNRISRVKNKTPIRDVMKNQSGDCLHVLAVIRTSVILNVFRRKDLKLISQRNLTSYSWYLFPIRWHWIYDSIDKDWDSRIPHRIPLASKNLNMWKNDIASIWSIPSLLTQKCPKWLSNRIRHNHINFTFFCIALLKMASHHKLK